MQQIVPKHQRLHAVVKHGWMNFIHAARPHRHVHRPLTPSSLPAPAIDPVALTMLAVNRLGPATVRTATNGKALTVTVPDAGTAEIFRAALREMQKTRCTDRLVDIIVTEEPASRRSAADAGAI